MRKAYHYSRPQSPSSFPPAIPLLDREIFYSMPPSQSATAPGGSKRKADLHEDCVGPNLKKARAFPITQEASQPLVTIPSQLQETQAGVRPLNIPPEILAIKIELNDLISFPVIPSVQFPPCAPFLSTVIAREDIAKIERRFYPYLWFPERAPYMLQGTDYNNILCPPFVGAMKMALQRVGIDCGTLALTAGYQLVLFFEGGNKKAALDAVVKKMGPGFCDSARWQGAIGIPRQNNLVAHMGNFIQQGAQGGSDSNTSQSNTGQSGDHTGQYPETGPSYANTAQSSIHHHISNQTGYADLTADDSTTNQAGFPSTVTGYEIGGVMTSQTSVSQPSDQVENVDLTADVSTTNHVGFPCTVTGYEIGGAMTSQSSFSQPSDQVANVDATDWAQLFTAFTDQPQVPAQASYPDVPLYEQAQFYGQQVGNQDPFGQAQTSLPEADIAAPAPELGGHNQPQPSRMGFDANGNFDVANLTDQEFHDLISSEDLAYDSVQQVYYLQRQGPVPGFSGPSAGPGDFTGMVNHQTWNS